MNSTACRNLISLVFITLALVIGSFAATQSLTGVISDDMCNQKHMMPGHSDADCTRACVTAGSKYVLTAGDKMYVLKGDSKQIGQHAGKTVNITGELAGKTFQVKSIADVK